MVSVCLSSDALFQHLPSYLCFSYLGRGVSLHTVVSRQIPLHGVSHRSVAKRSYPSPKVKGGGQEDLPYVQGAAAARVQESREELLHLQGQEG